MTQITIDDTIFKKKMQELGKLSNQACNKALNNIADELLRLSNSQVPLDTGRLSSSGKVQDGKNEKEVIVGYHTKYAARLHENPQYNFRNGRKGKYLEDPLKQNMTKWARYVEKSLQEVTK